MPTTTTHNPELYAQMAVPYEDEEAARHSLTAFLADVKKLREQHRIAECMVLCQAFAKQGDHVLVIGDVMHLGSSGAAARLAAAAYDGFTVPVFEEAKRLRKIAKGDR